MSEGAVILIILIICLFTAFVLEAVMRFSSRQGYSEIYIDSGDEEEDEDEQ